MKRSPLRKKGKSDISKLQKKLWELIRQIVLKRDERNGKHYCYTCGREVEGSNRQVGHFIPKAACPAELKYSPDNLKIQCYHCNINLGGNGAEFYRRLVEEFGQEYVDDLFKRKNQVGKADRFWYEEQINRLTQILNER